jgi:hypothetical protein
MVLFKAGPFDVLNCLNLNPFDKEVVKRFERRCGDEGKGPIVVLQLLMRFYAKPKIKVPAEPTSAAVT